MEVSTLLEILDIEAGDLGQVCRRHCVSTLLEILARKNIDRDIHELLDAIKFQPFLRFWVLNQGKLHSCCIRVTVSTLLEILPVDAGVRLTKCYSTMFQPFLRF